MQQQELDKQVGQQRRTDSTAKGWFLTWAMDGSGIEQNLHVFLLLTQQKSNTADGAGFSILTLPSACIRCFFFYFYLGLPHQSGDFQYQHQDMFCIVLYDCCDLVGFSCTGVWLMALVTLFTEC